MDLAEQILVEDCQQGNSEAFASLYDKYVKKIYNFVYYKTFHKETAEDITSTVFFKALRSINQFRPDYSFSSWLYTIARNAVTDHFRTNKQLSNIDDIWDLGVEIDFQKEFDVSEQLKNVKEYLHTLPQIQREIIIMRVWQGLSYREISEILGKTEQNCKVIFSRSIKVLRQKIPIAALLFLFL